MLAFAMCCLAFFVAGTAAAAAGTGGAYQEQAQAPDEKSEEAIFQKIEANQAPCFTNTQVNGRKAYEGEADREEKTGYGRA